MRGYGLLPGPCCGCATRFRGFSRAEEVRRREVDIQVEVIVGSLYLIVLSRVSRCGSTHWLTESRVVSEKVNVVNEQPFFS